LNEARIDIEERYKLRMAVIEANYEQKQRELLARVAEERAMVQKER
jgi:hypothetical protein